MDNDKAISKINELLRGEISAVETYRIAIQKEEHSSDVQRLRDIQQDHEHAVSNLKSHVSQMGGKPEQGSGAWGAWAKTVEGTATIFGDKTALKALKEGEEHGLKQYQAIINDADAPGFCKDTARTLLPKQQQHVQYLDQLISAH